MNVWQWRKEFPYRNWISLSVVVGKCFISHVRSMSHQCSALIVLNLFSPSLVLIQPIDLCLPSTAHYSVVDVACELLFLLDFDWPSIEETRLPRTTEQAQSTL